MTKEYSDYLAHHGVRGQKWGVRRYQNEDGTLINPKGRTHYDGFTQNQKKMYDKLNDRSKKSIDKRMDKGKSFTRSYKETIDRNRKVGMAAVVAGTLAIGAGAYALTYFGTKGLMTVGLKTASAVSKKMEKSQAWHNLKNRVRAMKTGDIVLGKKDYTMSGGWLNGVRR